MEAVAGGVLQQKGIQKVRWVLCLMQVKRLAQVMCAIALITSFVSPAFAKKNRTTSSPKRPLNSQNASAYGTPFEKEILKYLGLRYRSGGSSPQGVDCSGFVGLVYRNIYGVELPHQSGSQFLSSSFRKVDMDDLSTGDLVFFSSSKKNKRISHVGIYLSEGNFIHAATGKGVIISSLGDAYWKPRIAGAKRMIGQEARDRAETGLPKWRSLLSPDHQDSLSSQAPATSLSITYRPEMLGIATGHPAGESFGLELGYAKALLGDAWDLRLSVFRDSLLTWRRSELYNSLPANEEFPFSTARPDVASVQGIRLASELSPFEWLRVTPTLSYLKYGDSIDDTGLPRRSVGVDLALGSLSEGWILSTSFQYSSLTSTKLFSYEPDAFDTLDMSFTVVRRLSDNWLVSLMGERTRRLDTISSDSLREEKGWDDQRFSILFSFTR
jgi:hypothetical protein